MRRITKFAGITFLTFTAGILAWVFYHASYVGMGPIVDEGSISNGTFQMRIIMRKETQIMGGSYYIFQSTSDLSSSWHEIAKRLQDEPWPVPRDQIRFVNDSVGYMFMGELYVVTTDMGRTWSVFNIRTSSPVKETDKYIHNVHIAQDGSGIMTIHSTFLPPDEIPKLYTKDYGRHWELLR